MHYEHGMKPWQWLSPLLAHFSSSRSDHIMHCILSMVTTCTILLAPFFHHSTLHTSTLQYSNSCKSWIHCMFCIYLHIHSINISLLIPASQQAKISEHVYTTPAAGYTRSSLLVGIIYAFALIAMKTTTKYVPRKVTTIPVNEMSTWTETLHRVVTLTCCYLPLSLSVHSCLVPRLYLWQIEQL